MSKKSLKGCVTSCNETSYNETRGAKMENEEVHIDVAPVVEQPDEREEHTITVNFSLHHKGGKDAHKDVKMQQEVVATYKDSTSVNIKSSSEFDGNLDVVEDLITGFVKLVTRSVRS